MIEEGNNNLQTMKAVIVDPVKCIGCGLCVQLCPGVFQMQDDGKSIANNPAADEQCSQGAVDACPVQAISWKEEEAPKEES